MSDSSRPSGASATGSTPEAPFAAARRALAWRYSALATLALAVISGATYALFAGSFAVDFDEGLAGENREDARHERYEDLARESALGELAESILLIDALAAVLLVAASHALAARAIAPLEAAYLRERRLLADMAHELRTPLAVVRASAEVAAGGSDEDRRRFAESAIEEVDQMAATVSDLLFLEASRIAGAVGDAVDLVALARRQVARAAAYASSHGVSLSGPADGEAAVLISGREADLGRAIGNLIKNALDFTPASGSVSVRVAGDGRRATLTVADTGCGIAAEDLPRVFDRFFKADSSRARRAGQGSGLGLAIVREIARAHGGDAAVSSEVGRGTSVTLSLPRS